MDRVMPKIDTYRLLIFYHVCREKGITAAAEKLLLSQPTVTSHMKILESSLQAKLFRFERKKLILTNTGEGLFEYAREIFQQSMAAERFIEISRESSLNIGVSSLLVQRVAKALNTLPGQCELSNNLVIRSGESFSLVRDLTDSQIDLAVLPDFDFGESKFKHIRIADKVKLIFYASSHNPIFQKDRTDWSNLLDYPLIVGTANSPIKQILAKKIIDKKISKSPQFYLTADNFELYKIIVKNSNCISFSLLEDITEDIDRGALKVIPLPDDICVDIDIMCSPAFLSVPLVKEFISCIKTAFK